MKNLYVNVSRETRMVNLPKQFIAVDGENLQSKLIFTFVDEFVNGQARLEYEIKGNKNYVILDKENNTYTIPVKNVITKEGQIDMQLVITESSNEDEIPVFKSNKFYLYCNSSINAVEEAPDGYDLWIEQANTILNEVDKVLDIIKTDGNGTKYLSDDGTYKYVQGGGTSEGGTSNYEELNNLPSVNGVELKGNKSLDDLGIQPKGDYALKSDIGGADTSDVVEEILEFSQTTIPKTFNLEVGYMNSTGEELDNSNYYRSDFIKIDTAFKYYLLVNNITNTSQTFCYYLYDENKSLIQTRITIPIEAQTLKKQRIYPSSGTKYARILITKGLKDCLVRVYADENIEHATKKELRKATYGSPRIVDVEDYYRPIEENLLEYFGPNKKVVLVGDSFTQGLGSTEFINYDTIDDDGDSVNIVGNGYDYGVMHNLPNYESGVKLYKSGRRVWHEAIDGNGYAQRLKNYLQNKFGCSVNNYAMSGITSATLLSKTMNPQNSDLVTSDGTSVETLFNTQDDWEFGNMNTDGSLVPSTAIIRTKDYINFSDYSGDITVTTSDANIKFKVFYYDDNGFKENTGWKSASLVLDKSKGTKARIQLYTGDLTKYSVLTITAENSGDIMVIEGVTKGFDTVFLTIGGNDRGFKDYISPSTGQTVTGKEQHKTNLKKLVDYILGTKGELVDSTDTIRTKDYIDFSDYDGDITVSVLDGYNYMFKVAYYDANDDFVDFSDNWKSDSLVLDKTKGTKALVKVLTSEVTKFDRISITGENSGTTTNIFNTQNDWELGSIDEGKKLILMSMTPCKNDADEFDPNNDINTPMWDIDDAIQEVAEEYNLPFVSNYQGMTKYCEITGIDINTLRNYDGLHPTDEGYAVVEALVCKGLGINEIDKKYVNNLVGNIEDLLGGI